MAALNASYEPCKIKLPTERNNAQLNIFQAMLLEGYLVVKKGTESNIGMPAEVRFFFPYLNNRNAVIRRCHLECQMKYTRTVIIARSSESRRILVTNLLQVHGILRHEFQRAIHLFSKDKTFISDEDLQEALSRQDFAYQAFQWTGLIFFRNEIISSSVWQKIFFGLRSLCHNQIRSVWALIERPNKGTDIKIHWKTFFGW